MAVRPPLVQPSRVVDPYSTASTDRRQTVSDTDRAFLDRAFAQAEAAAAADEVPIGAVLVDPATGTVIAEAGNATETLADPTAHAEIRVLRMAARAAGRPRLPGYDLYVTLEPCPMCAAAIANARLRRVVYAAPDPKMGGVAHGPRIFDQPTCHHRPLVVADADPQRSAALLRAFFRAKRARGKRRFEG